MSLNSKEAKLIKLLTQHHDWLSAVFLAETLSTSTRTIRNYVARINQSTEQEIICSSRQGYKINDESPFDEIISQNRKEMMTPKDRINYLMNLLIQHSTIDYFDVAETLFISIPTIEKDLHRLRKKMDKYHLKIIKNGQFLTMTGDEINFRKLTSDMLQDEALHNFQSLDHVQTIFPDIPIERIQKIVVERLSNQHLYVNGYAINSLLLHIAIAVDRLLHHQRSDIELTSELFSEDQLEYKIASEIGKDIHQAFSVEMDLYEINNLTLLLMTKISPANETFLKNYMDTTIYAFISSTMETVAEKYFIPNISDELVLNLALHVSNLISRAKRGKQVRNPLSEEIKQSYAFIYEVAVFIAKQIQKQINIPITDDEITFIALHIGSYFEEKFETENKLSCVIYTPEYYEMHKRLVYKISDIFKKNVNITGAFYRLDEQSRTEMLNADLVLSTIELKELPNALQLSPFLSGKDIDKVQKEINLLKQKKLVNDLKESIGMYLTSERFERNVYLQSEHEYIDYLGGKLVESNHIDLSFIELIKEREKMSATSFNNSVALPHAIEMSAEKTGISIILNDRPVRWGTHYVQVIIMIVMNQGDMKKFRQLFDFMIDTFSTTEKLEKLLLVKNYEEFIEELFN
ncbi:BglG family transcription antiterminator [Enterococcus wangshanyuanii]|uniref:Transcriptional antiterminator n=1 Tax=Enterococcus wangshanyuanii TaxID=2005703 RepID=A0ABQ1NGH2_9ENTE|nr:PRD domain-containing protein [Enterococcus wangshanyuanii]GGC76023.1 transcriptional antiterminator [Enterococcus wangshanyuanii]